MDAAAFIDQSDLIWRYPDESTVIVAHNVDSDRLGARLEPPAYLSPLPSGLWWRRLVGRLFPSVRRSSGSYAASAFTRPFDARSDRESRLLPAEGFALLARVQRPGMLRGRKLESVLSQAPVYYEIIKAPGETFICYWLFFGTSTRPLGPFNVPKRKRGPKRNGPAIGTQEGEFGRIDVTIDPIDLVTVVTLEIVHQGDWEGITVRVADGKVSYHFRAHGKDTRVLGSQEVELRDDTEGRPTRPVVYCARGSHACYPSLESEAAAGSNDLLSAEGPLWDPVSGENLLRPVREEAWFGFGGAWGNPDLDLLISFRDHMKLKLLGRTIPLERSDFCGPLGPSEWKAVWPAQSPSD